LVEGTIMVCQCIFDEKSRVRGRVLVAQEQYG
jgi:hypothetical protein